MSDISEHRLDRLEQDVSSVKATLGRLEPMIIRMDERLNATLPHLATKAELTEGLAGVRLELADGLSAARREQSDGLAGLRSELADKPGKTFVAVAIGVLLAAYAAGLAAIAALSVLRALHLFS